MARKFTYIQIETLKKKGLEALREMICKTPNEAQQYAIGAEFQSRYRGVNDLADALNHAQGQYNIAKQSFDGIIQKCNTFMKDNGETGRGGISRADAWHTKERQPYTEFQKFIKAKKDAIAREMGYLVELKPEAADLLTENIIMADTKNKEMADILQDVIRKTFADINANRQKYICRCAKQSKNL